MDSVEPTSSAMDLLIAELREQIRFLREELQRARNQVEEVRQLSEEQLRSKDEHIAHLLSLLDEGRATAPRTRTIPEEEAPDPSAKRDSPGEPKPPGEKEADREETVAVAPSPSAPEDVLRQSLKSHADICPYLRARYDRKVGYTHATGSNGCWSPRIKKGWRQPCGYVDRDYQVSFCLNERHHQCVYFEEPTAGPVTVPPEEPPPRPRWPRWPPKE